MLAAVEVVYAFGILFATCELCQRVNLGFAECNVVIMQFKWYLFPANIRRILPLIIHYTQQDVDINCFGTSACNRITFKLVSILQHSIITFK